MLGAKLIPFGGVSTDLSNSYMGNDMARFIKNLTYNFTDNSEAGTVQGAQKGKMKPLESVEIYCPAILPAGDSYIIGSLSSRETNEIYVWAYNTQSNHFIFRVNGLTKTFEMIKIDPCLNFQYKPEYFIGEGQCWLEVNKFTDPGTGQEVIKKDLYWVDGFNYHGFLRTDDSIATNGFDPATFPYFIGNYDRCTMVRMGLPTSKDCIRVTEVPTTDADRGINNNILFSGWQFRITYIDVFGRPSEHGIISDLYVPGINDCLSSSALIARCLKLSIYAGNPFIDKIQIEYNNNNDEVSWQIDTVLELYTGSALGQWWLRARNPQIQYSASTNRIEYTFCRNKECTPIDPSETQKLQPALPRVSQALFKLTNKIAVANNKDSFSPLSQSLRDKFSLKIIPPSDSGIPLRTITVYVPIRTRNFGAGKNGPIGWASTGVSKRVGAAGYIWGYGPNSVSFSQYFLNPNQSGFIGYLSDGSYAVGTQVYVDENNNFIDDPDHNYNVLSPTRVAYQKFVFSAKKAGTYIFRISSHLSDTTIPNAVAHRGGFMNTSTTILGIHKFDPITKNLINQVDTTTQELLINVCDADYDSLNGDSVLTILDMGLWTKATSGYICEARNNGLDERYMELMSLVPENSSGGSSASTITDHNGFYWFASDNSYEDFFLRFNSKCLTTAISIGIGQNAGMRFITFVINEFTSNNVTPYPDFYNELCNRVLIKGRVILKGTNIGVSNLSVTYTRGQTTTTDSDGNFTVIAHDYVDKPTRDDKLVFNSLCNYISDSGGCLDVVDVTFMNYCSTCVLRQITTDTLYFQFLNQRGLLSGGTYALRASAYDWLGRKTYSQQLLDFTIPSINQSRAIGASQLQVSIASDAVFPPEFEYIVMSVTAETTISDWVDWIVDSVKFIDNTGNENLVAPTQIKIYYASLLEYNKQNNFNTTVNWQFIPANSTDPYTTDKVQFFINGDGKYFDKNIISLVKYDKEGQYFLIDYTSDLKDLKANAFIRLIRPKICTGTEPDYEICQVVDLINGKAQTNQFILNAFDTYYLSRQIPVPVAQDTDPVTYVNELRTFGFNFEHNSPSDLWGKGIWNRGRLNVKNPYESEIIRENQIALSGALSVTGQLNYLNNFDESGKTTLFVNNSGGIVYVKPKQGIILAICQYNHFVVGYGDNLPRVVNGQIQVPSTADSFGKPERDAVGDYGCILTDKSTIRENSGLVHFLDSNRISVLRHDYQKAEDVSSNKDNPKRKSTILSWLTKKIQYIRRWNETHDDKIYFHSVVNPASNEYLLSDFKLYGTDYINNERCYDVTKHETFAFDIFSQVWKCQYSFTPQYYAYLENDINGNQLFSFKNALTYGHYKTVDADISCDPMASSGNNTFNTFYGVKCARVFEFVYNGDDNTLKKFFQVLSVYCPESIYFADRIITETKQNSRLLISAFTKANYFTFAGFLRDLNTPVDPNLPNRNMIRDGNALTGCWIQVRLIGDPAMDDKYSELTGVTVECADQKKSGAPS